MTVLLPSWDVQPALGSRTLAKAREIGSLRCRKLAAPSRGEVTTQEGGGGGQEGAAVLCGVILGNCQYWAGSGAEAASQDLLGLVIRTLDTLVLAVCTCLLYHPSG